MSFLKEAFLVLRLLTNSVYFNADVSFISSLIHSEFIFVCSVGQKSTHCMKEAADVNDLPSRWLVPLGNVAMSGTQLGLCYWLSGHHKGWGGMVDFEGPRWHLPCGPQSRHVLCLCPRRLAAKTCNAQVACPLTFVWGWPMTGMGGRSEDEMKERSEYLFLLLSPCLAPDMPL